MVTEQKATKKSKKERKLPFSITELCDIFFILISSQRKLTHFQNIFTIPTKIFITYNKCSTSFQSNSVQIFEKYGQKQENFA